ncbi:endonuclease NucS [Aliarcobacter butzleri]|uniref:endonuclease NucS domain-containing protein n=1 Tax=Aliarcobacter butzleri TaxID=28197 RepID=UPI00263D8FEE|nr:endonuclease NucS domain-containing protein [Aliarcobacter butzleri]MDN5047566.1 endonuclease NucS [Aliarcobacter butzleri]
MKESDIRKHLFNYLTLYFPELVPIKEEQLVKYEEQYCFIDILAKDNENNFVIIELKKTNAATREAIHEIIKYSEFVKKTYAVNDDNIKIIIMSTEWKELFIPFSKFYYSNNLFDIKGVHLTVNDIGKYISHKYVEPIKFNDERVFSPEHLYCFYENEESLEKGIISFNEVMSKKDINDYLLFVLKKPKNVDLGHSFEYIIYFVMLRKSIEEYEKILKKIDPTGEASFIARYRNKMYIDSLEKTLNFTEYLPESDSFTNSATPICFNSLLITRWEIIEVKKFGRLDNEIFEDNNFINNTLNQTGKGDTMYNQKLNSSDKRKYNKLLDDISNVLGNNNLWYNQFRTIIKEYEGKDYELLVEVFNQTNILLSINQEESIVKYLEGVYTSLPFFKIEILNKDTYYIGTLIWTKTKEYDLDDILLRFYANDIFDKDKGFYFCSQTDHIRENNNILEYLDLEYNTLKYSKDKNEVFYNGIFKEVKSSTSTIYDFIDQEKLFCKKVVDEFNTLYGFNIN